MLERVLAEKQAISEGYISFKV